MIIVNYNRIRPIESYLCEYDGQIYTTKENLQTFPNVVTLINPMSIKEFKSINEGLIKALRGE